MHGYFLLSRRFAKARDVLVLGRFGFTAPRVVGVGDAGDLLRSELSPRPIHQMAELPGIDEQYLAAPITPAASGALVAGEKPEARRNLGGLEQLPRERDHAIDHVVLDHGLADRALA